MTVAICDGTEVTRVEHAKALLEDAGPISKVTGAILLGQLQNGCTEAEELEGVPQ